MGKQQHYGSLEKQSINFCFRSNDCCSTVHQTPAATSSKQLLRDCIQCRGFELSLTDVTLNPFAVQQTSPQISQSAGSEDAPLTFVFRQRVCLIQSREINSDIPLAGQYVGLGCLSSGSSNIYLFTSRF